MCIPGEDINSRWGYAFPVRMCILGESHPHSRWGCAFLVRHIPTPGEASPHSRWGCAFLFSHIAIPGEDVYSIMIFPHWEWGWVSPGMHILTGNRDLAFIRPGFYWCRNGGNRFQSNKPRAMFISLPRLPCLSVWPSFFSIGTAWWTGAWVVPLALNTPLSRAR